MVRSSRTPFGYSAALTLERTEGYGRSPLCPQSAASYFRYTTRCAFSSGMMGAYYLVVLFLQQVLGFSPALTGLATLPFRVDIVLAAGISTKLVETKAPRTMAVPGLLIVAAGMFWLSRLTTGSSYAGHVMPALFLVSFGLGPAAVTMTLTAVHNVKEDQAGVASTLVKMAQQIGAALGLATLTTIALSSANTRMPGAAAALQRGVAGSDQNLVVGARDALTHGYAVAFLVWSGVLLAAAVITGVSVNTKHTQSASDATVVH